MVREGSWAFEKQDINVDSAIAPIAEALHHENLDYRLKGSDRYFKVIGIDQKQENQPAAVHFHQHLEAKKDGYDFGG